ncbi:DNA cytosine methyltransferase [Streptomyces sp. AM 2-1-1]|uniref:DNA cytosine methyltransferase n=1 Tax=Streptomyces sp. AM 2-1-1 TaxID=3028709 RepID=UPI0023B8D1B9|nr:DNA cytosine methyltransferase [Streptomyces sp. AM 2-1-1]WEH41652.1 DNA cytosine methyltransferase [Streptomyces sp. AM 2-1-1]
MTHPPHPSLSAARFKIVDLFAGPGGLDIAATIMDEVESIGVEWDDPTRATRRAAGLLTTAEKDVAALGPCDPEVVDANVLTGGPPCQSFSVAGNREGHKALEDVKRLASCLVDHTTWTSFDSAWQAVRRETDSMSDDRTGLVLQPLRWIMEAKLRRRKPYEVIVLEQVPTVLPVWKHYVELLRRTGYAAEAHVLHSEDFGVPQARRRAVLIAQWDPRNTRRKVRFPKATHQRYRKGADRLPAPVPSDDRLGQQAFEVAEETAVLPWVSMGDALGERRPESFVMVSNYGSGGDPKDRGRRTSSEPAATVTGKVRRNRLFRLKETESGDWKDGEELDRLSFEEAGLLQSFPAAYPWRSTDIAQQIGNAIPPRLSLHILSEALFRDAPEKQWLEALARWRPPTSTSDEDAADD